MATNRYPRDLSGQFCKPKNVEWPQQAKIAVQFVLNYEEGGENCLLHGDEQSEGFLSEIVSAAPWPNQRHWNMESIYEYGARAGFWRVHDLFTEKSIPVTVYAVATALARSPEQICAMQEADWEIACHGYKWIEYKDFSTKEEQDHIKKAIDLHSQVTGTPPKGWYTGRASMNSVNLVCETGEIDYISDSYADDLPYWYVHQDKPQLIIPYTLDANDMRFAAVQGFNSGDQFFAYLRDSFDALYREGQNGAPKILSIGLHCRLIGRPGRIESLRKFLDYIEGFSDVWCPRRIDISNHWHEHYPFDMVAWLKRPTALTKQEFVERFADSFEHASWVVEDAFDLELGAGHDTAKGLHNAFCRTFRAASQERRESVLKSQTGCIDTAFLQKHLTQKDTPIFKDLCNQYVEKFGFPYILAESDAHNCSVLANLENRLKNDYNSEFAESCRQVEHAAFTKLSNLV